MNVTFYLMIIKKIEKSNVCACVFKCYHCSVCFKAMILTLNERKQLKLRRQRQESQELKAQS